MSSHAPAPASAPSIRTTSAGGGRWSLGRSLRGRRRVVAWGAVIGAVAFLVRLRLLTHGAGLASSDGYDDGVYYAAAAALTHGRLPYRDFLLLHPPGIVVALAPFTAIGAALGDHVGVAVARIVFLGIGAGNAVLLAAIAARHSRAAGLLAGTIAAVLFPLAYAERSTLLEPLGSALLLAAVLLGRRTGRWVAPVAGAVAGLSVDVKVWYLVPVLILAACDRRRAVPFLLGAAGAAGALAAPFLLAAPATMVREVLLDQLGRPSSAFRTVLARLTLILGDPFAGGTGTTGQAVTSGAALLTAGVVAVAMVAAWRHRWARVFVVLTLATTAVLLAGPSFFPHYVAFAAPWGILSTAIGAATVVGRLRLREQRIVAVAVVLLAVVVADAGADLRHVSAAAQPAGALRQVLSREEGCVLSDDPGLLADSDVLTRDLQQGCPLWPDVTGWTYDLHVAHGTRAARAQDPVWQREVTDYLLSGDLVVVARPATGLSAASKARIRALPRVLRTGGLTVHRVR